MGQDREDRQGPVPGVAGPAGPADPDRETETKEEVDSALRYERGLLWKAGVALLVVLLIAAVRLFVTW